VKIPQLFANVNKIRLKCLIFCSITLAMTTACSTIPDYSLSDHYNGTRFYNTPPVEGMSARQLLEHVLSSHSSQPWKVESLEQEVNPEFSSTHNATDLSVTFVNHATVLLQVDGLVVLTDPVWAQKVGPFSTVGVKRARQPGIAFEQLPKVDLVLISHNHYDHLDIPTLRRLRLRDDPLFLVPLGNLPLLWKKGIRRVVELDWWQSFWFASQIEIVLTPARHQSGRSLWDNFSQIRKRLGPINTALLPIGAYKPRAVHRSVHMDPQDAVKAHEDLQASLSIPIHYGTFQLTKEYFHESVDELKAILGNRPISKEFQILKQGETLVLDKPSDRP